MIKESLVYETEVLVVGAGPSGCATAISLLNYTDASVMLIEQSDFTNLRVGEQVSATLFKFIDYLKLTQTEFSTKDYMPSFDSVSYWGSAQPSTRNAIFSTEESSFQLNREAFDIALVQKVSDLGGEVFPRTKIQRVKQRDSGRWELLLRHDTEGEFRIIATYLIDATGRNAKVSHQLGVAPNKKDNLVGVGCFLTTPNNHQLEFGHIIESYEDGWWYCAQLPNKQLVVSLFSDADIVSEQRLNSLECWQKKLSQTVHLKKQLQGATLNSDKTWVRNASSQVLQSALPSHFMSVGDAACAFDPISSMGIGFALSSGCQAALSIANHRENAASFSLYQHDLENIFNDYWAMRKTIYEKESRWRHASFWKRRIGGNE